MKKILSLIAVAVLSVSAVKALDLDSATVTPIIAIQSIAATNTLTSTNYSFGPVYPSTNGVANNISIAARGPVLFVANSTTVATNTLTVTLQESSNASNWTNALTWKIGATSPVVTNYDVGTLAKYWRVTIASTNASAATATVSLNATWFNKYQ